MSSYKGQGAIALPETRNSIISANNSLLINYVAIGKATNIMGSDSTRIGNHADP
jgi:hypothetical protein